MTRLWFDTALLPDGWARQVRVSIAADGIITSVEAGVGHQSGDEIGSVALPGVANLHSHAFQRGMAGLAEVRGPSADNFWTWRQVMYYFLSKLTPTDVQAITAQAYMEMLEAGFTRVGEFHYLHHDRDGVPFTNPAEMSEQICAAATTTGINLTLLPVFYAHSNFGGLAPTEGQRRFVTSPDQFAALFESAGRAARSLPGGTVGVAPHSLRAVMGEELAAIISICPDGPIHIHVAEQVKEVEDCLAASGARPVQWLLDHASVDERWCIIHATHMDAWEAARLAATGATVGLCPITEANLGDGIFPATVYVSAGGRFGIGTDSNLNISLAGELCMLEYSQRLSQRTRNVIANHPGESTGRALFDAAQAGGSAALAKKQLQTRRDAADAGSEALARAGSDTRKSGSSEYLRTGVWSSEMGSKGRGGIQVGASADILLLACEFAQLSDREKGDMLLDRFIFAGKGGPAVDRVWVRGQCVVSGGRHFRREEVSSRFRATLRRILSA